MNSSECMPFANINPAPSLSSTQVQHRTRSLHVFDIPHEILAHVFSFLYPNDLAATILAMRRSKDATIPGGPSAEAYRSFRIALLEGHGFDESDFQAIGESETMAGFYVDEVVACHLYSMQVFIEEFGVDPDERLSQRWPKNKGGIFRDKMIQAGHPELLYLSTPLAFLTSVCSGEEAISFLDLLLNNGADPSILIEQGDKPVGRWLARWTYSSSTPFHYMIAMGDIEVIRKLLAEKPELAVTFHPQGATALHYAAFRPHRYRRPNCQVSPVVAELVKAGAAIDAIDDWGKTPLAHARDEDSDEAVKALFEHGADITKAVVRFTGAHRVKKFHRLEIADPRHLKVAIFGLTSPKTEIRAQHEFMIFESGALRQLVVGDILPRGRILSYVTDLEFSTVTTASQLREEYSVS